MANTKIPVELSSTPGIVDGSNATAITIDSSERVGIGVTPSDHSGYMLQITGGSQSFIAIGNDTTGTGALNGLIVGNDSSGADIYQRENQPLRFHTNNTERLRLDSSGNLGIGTTSPSSYYATDVVVGAGSEGGITIASSATSYANYLMFADGTSGTDRFKGYIAYAHATDSFYIVTSDDVRIYTGSSQTEKMRIDASGNVGIGASPNANYRNDGSATEKYLQVGAAAVLFADSGITTALANNCAINNSDQRIALSGTNPGSMYEQYQGIHNFYTTDSVAAGNAQTLTARFRINQNGDLQGTDTSISSISDERIKKNIADYTDGLNLIKNLKPRTFEFKDTTGIRKTGTQRGFIAQEVLEHDTYWISEEDATDIKDGEYEYTKDTEKRYLSKLNDKDAMYVSAIQEQQKLIETQQTTINDLKSRIETLEG